MDEQNRLTSVFTDPSIRRKTVTAILSHLDTRSAKHTLTKTECLQLWRGFHVAVYMHDSKNALSVQNLLREIAGTFATIARKDDELAAASDHDSEHQLDQWLEPYHTAFHETITREWASIDSHRMNKYLLLVRFVMQQLFRICFKPQQNVNQGQIKASKKTVSRKRASTVDAEVSKSRKATSILTTLRTVGPLNPKDPKIPNGLRLHILDIWVDELFGSLSALEAESEAVVDDDDGGRSTESTIALFREPLVAIAESHSGAQKNIRERAKEAIADFDEKIATLSNSAANDSSE